MLRRRLRRFSFVGQPAFFENSGAADFVRPVHAVPARLDFRRSGDHRARERAGNGTAGLYSARLEQRFRRRLLFSDAEANAVCRGGHAGHRIFSLGPLFGQLSADAGKKLHPAGQRRIFRGGGAATVHRRQHDRFGARGNSL